MRLAGAVALAACALGAPARPGWFFECIDPENEQPYSDDYGTTGVSNILLSVRLGVSGNVTYGGENGPCYAPGRTLDASGRLAFSVGSVGSSQTEFDDGLALTTGAPGDPVGDFCFARFLVNGDSFLFGDGGLSGVFSGASRRYIVAIWRNATIDVNLTIRLLGDAARLEWRVTNLSGNPIDVALAFAAYVGMMSVDGRPDEAGYNQAHSLLGTLSGRPKFVFVEDQVPYIGYVVTDKVRPIRTERNYLRTSPNFPDRVDFLFGQTSAYGLRIDNQAFDETRDASRVEQFLIGNHGNFTSPGLLFGNTLRFRVFDDFSLVGPPLEVSDIPLNETSFIQRFQSRNIAPNGQTSFVHYVRSPWSFADYNDPYAVVVDAPQLIGTEQGPGGVQLTPNPFRIIAYIDNQYATVDRAIQLSDVRLTLELPEGSGLSLPPGETRSKILNRVLPNALESVEWTVVVDEGASGEVPFSIKVEPVPGPIKTIRGRIMVGSTPRLTLPEGANYVTFPWTFPDSNLDRILGLTSGVDYLAFAWDPDQLGYVPTSSAVRGRGIWVVPLRDLGTIRLAQPSVPADQSTGGLLINLRRGWNAIGNPYNYPVRLTDLVAVAEDDPANTITWRELVDNGLISPTIAKWVRDPNDPTRGRYEFTEGANALIEPNQGYWIFVSTFRPIRLSWPAVYIKGLPNSGRTVETTWPQTDRHWRLQLVARTVTDFDSANTLGVVPDEATARRSTFLEPPMAPGSSLQMWFESATGGGDRLAQAVAVAAPRREWRAFVRSDKAGEVTLSWPNLGSIPANARVRLTDLANGTSFDLRSRADYAFRFEEPGTREFSISIETGGAVRPVIGNVIVSRDSRDPAAPFTITYTLSSDATTSIRILSGTGREVFTVSRGRSDRAGENTAIWQTRDNANRAVPPGSYTVEILAETPSGERVRRVVPLNVTR